MRRHLRVFHKAYGALLESPEELWLARLDAELPLLRRREALPLFLKALNLCGEGGGTTLVDFIQSPKPHQFHELTWSYPGELIAAEASEQDLDMAVVADSDSPALVRLKEFCGNDFTLVKLTRKPSANT